MNWKIFRVLSLALFFSALGLGVVVPLLPAYAHGLGASGLFIGLIFGAFPLARSLCLPVVGRFSDIKGRKPFVITGFFLYSLVSFGFMIFTDVTILILIRFLQGVSTAMIIPVAESYAGEITPKGDEGKMMGLLSASYAAGLCSGPVIGGIAKDVFGMQAAFLIMTVSCLSGWVICMIFLPPRKQEHIVVRENNAVNYTELLQNRYIAGLFMFRFIYTLCIGAVWTYAPLLAFTQYKLTGLAIGVMITIAVLSSAVTMAPMGMMADKIDKKFLLLLGGCIMFCGMYLFPHNQKVWELYLVCVLLGMGDGILKPPLMAMAVIMGRQKDSMGTVVSLLALAESLGSAVGPILAGIMSDKFGIVLTFGGCAVMMLLITVLTIFLIRDFRSFENIGFEIPLTDEQDACGLTESFGEIGSHEFANIIVDKAVKIR